MFCTEKTLTFECVFRRPFVQKGLRIILFLAGAPKEEFLPLGNGDKEGIFVANNFCIQSIFKGKVLEAQLIAFSSLFIQRIAYCKLLEVSNP